MRFATLDELIAFLEKLASVPSEEGLPMSELDHGLQCAAVLGERCAGDPELQVAGLVHDVGHTLGRNEDHGTTGAAATRLLLGRRVADLVELHIPAKRWLVTRDPDYRARLSPGSIETLRRQGGTMSDAEVAAFEGHPAWRDAVVLRRADDQAKEPGRTVPGLSHWIPTLREVAGRVTATPSRA